MGAGSNNNINEANITLRPVDVFYGLRNKDKVTTVADVADSLLGTYFDFDSTDIDGTLSLYRLHFGGAPAADGRTLIDAGAVTGLSAAGVASAADTALTADAGRFSNCVSGADLFVEAGSMGTVTAAVDGSVATGFTFLNQVVGDKFSFGATDDVSLSPEFSFVDVTASQLGETLLDQIQNGNNISVSVPAKEVIATLFQKTLGDVAGDNLTVGADIVTGVGESKRFTNMKALSKELMLRPSGETDLTNAWSVWRAKPDLTGLNFSGSDLQVLELDFSAYRDGNRPSEVSLAAFGKADKGMLV